MQILRQSPPERSTTARLFFDLPPTALFPAPSPVPAFFFFFLTTLTAAFSVATTSGLDSSFWSKGACSCTADSCAGGDLVAVLGAAAAAAAVGGSSPSTSTNIGGGVGSRGGGVGTRGEGARRSRSSLTIGIESTSSPSEAVAPPWYEVACD